MGKWIKRIGWVGIVVLLLFNTLGNPIVQRLVSDLPVGFARVVLTVGLFNVAYAAAPDYPVTGDADDEVQAALNALPSTGGKVVIFGGDYTFASTVSRAINNVTFEGSGRSTYLAHDASTPLISVGSQTDWIFSDFSTDAGWLTLASDTVVDGCWNNGTYTLDLQSPEGIVRSVTLVVAGNNASNSVRAQADYVCNGTTDNVGIQAALDTLTTNRTWQETVKLIGDFSISAQINPDSYTLLDLREANLTLANGADDHIILLPSAVTGVTIIGGILDGNRANNAGNLVGIGLGNNSDNLKVEGTTIRYTKGSGMNMGTVEHITITKCYIHDVGDDAYATHGIYLAGTSWALISQNIIHDSNSACIGLATACYNITISENLVYNSGDGDPIAGYASGNRHILVKGNICRNSGNNGMHMGGKHIIIQGNTIEGSTEKGIGVVNDSGVAEYVVISGNIITGSGTIDLYLNSVNNTVVADNYIYSTGTSSAVQLITVHNLSFTGNVIVGDGSAGDGIYLYAGPRAIISGNQIRGHGRDGIRVYETTYLLFVNNQVEGNATWGYRDLTNADYNYLAHNLFANNTSGDVSAAANTTEHAW